MINWSIKELVSIYSYSNIDQDRKCTKSVRINGRLYDKHGVDCATTAIALVYKVYDPSINRNKFAVLIGIARQSPGDTVLSLEVGEEIATENAMMNPIMIIEYPEEPNENAINCLIRSYIIGLPVQFVKTRQEIEEEGKDISQYNRNIRKKEYYDEYYQEFKKIFLNE